MASRRRARWLSGEIARWAEEGLVSAETAHALDVRYAGRAEGGTVPLFAVLGAALVGLGAILLIGHNWEALSRGARAALCFALLGSGQGLALFAAWRRPRSVAWSEGAGVFLALALAGALALISQTYQLPGDLRGFLGICGWLVLPVAYALASRGVVLLLLVQALALLGLDLAQGGAAPWHWVRLAVLVPFFALHGREGTARLRDGVLAAAGWLTLVASVLVGLATWGGATLLLGGAALAAGLHAVGGTERSHDAEREVLWRPALALGLLGILGAVGLLGVAPVWEVRELGGLDDTPWAQAPALAMALAGALWAAWAVARRESGVRLEAGLVALLPVVVLAGLLGVEPLGDATGSRAAAVLVSVYGLALGVQQVLRGARDGERGRANLGAALIVVAVGQRFLTADWSFTVRGVAFVLAGGLFLGLNLWLRRRPRGASTRVGEEV